MRSNCLPEPDAPCHGDGRAEGNAAPQSHRIRRERARRSGVIAIASLLAVACAGRFGRAPPSESLVLSRFATHVVGHPRDVDLTLRNDGDEPLIIPRPSPAFLLVVAETDRGIAIRCQTPPPLPERVAAVTLPPGGAIGIRVDLVERCEVGKRSEFVAEVRFSVPDGVRDRPGGSRSWTGVTRAVRLQVAPSAEAAAIPSGVEPIGPAPR